jgi:hypothetical protein
MMQIVAPQPPTPPAIEQFPVIVDTGPAWSEIAPAIVMSVLLIGSIFLLLPLVRAWARRIEGKGGDPMVVEELAQLRERVAELDHMSMRVHELEERLDFAERLLVQRDAGTPHRIEGQH